MATLHRRDHDNLLCVKGSPEQVLALCADQLTATGPAPLEHDRIHAEAEALASNALRLLAIARKSLPKDKTFLTPEDLHRPDLPWHRGHDRPAPRGSHQGHPPMPAAPASAPS